MVKNISVIIASCDKYRDAWEPFFTLFFKYWPDCPFKIYLCAENLNYSDQRVKTITVGFGRAWSSSLKLCLKEVKTKYVILLQEDFFLQNYVSTNEILNLAIYMKHQNAACLKLYPAPRPNKPTADNPCVGEIVKGTKYRVSLQAAIWNKDILNKLLEDGESAWDFEDYGSLRSNKYINSFLSVDPSKVQIPLDYFSTAISGGIWVRSAVKLCKKEGVKIDNSSRKVESIFREYDRTYLRGKVYGAAKKIMRIMHFFRRSCC